MAIIAVVAYHYHLAPGGFVGVDVFFVISGFLITRILLKAMEEGQFSFLLFYQRRILRLFPALMTMLITVSVADWMLLSPPSLVKFGEALIASSLYVSNIYFAVFARYKYQVFHDSQLLHTWSLGVEEQFYLLYPLFLWFLFRRHKPKLLPAFLSLAVVSFTLCIFLTENYPRFGFYLLPSRIWEILLGGIVALRNIPIPKNRLQREIVSLSGAAAIGWALTTFDKHTVFPGAISAVPVLGTVAILWACNGGKTLLDRALSQRALVGVGLLSYSLYLWHWPILHFFEYQIEMHQGPAYKLLSLSLTLALSFLSWRFVETPFRGRRLRQLHPRVLPYSALASATILLVGVVLVQGEGFPGRANPRLSNYFASMKTFRSIECDFFFSRGKRNLPCKLGSPDHPPTFAVWGDSHARTNREGLSFAAREYGRTGVLLAYSGCPSILDFNASDRSGCKKHNEDMFTFIANTPSIRSVILLFNFQVGNSRYPYLVSLFEKTLDRILKAGKTVAVVAPIPNVNWNTPDRLFMASLWNLPLPRPLALVRYERRKREELAYLEKLPHRFPVQVVYPHQALCSISSCAATEGELPLYDDFDHLSEKGSLRMRKIFHPVLGN